MWLFIFNIYYFNYLLKFIATELCLAHTGVQNSIFYKGN